MKTPYVLRLCLSLALLSVTPFVMFAMLMTIGFSYGGLAVVGVYFGMLLSLLSVFYVYMKRDRREQPLSIYQGSKVLTPKEQEALIEYLKRHHATQQVT